MSIQEIQLKNKYLVIYKKLRGSLDSHQISQEEKEAILSRAHEMLQEAQENKKNPKDILETSPEDYLLHESNRYRRSLYPRKIVFYCIRFFFFASALIWITQKWILKSSWSDYAMASTLFFGGLFHLENLATPLASQKKSTLFYRILSLIMMISSILILVGTYMGLIQ